MKKLIEVSLEASRITHHNGLAYLGGVVASLFAGIIRIINSKSFGHKRCASKFMAFCFL